MGLISLDILIPSFNDLRFLNHIQNFLKSNDNKSIKINVIISDDSTDPYVRREIISFCNKKNFRYLRGPQTGNPVDNWNQLLYEGTSDFFLLLHHDEILISLPTLNRGKDRSKTVFFSTLSLCDEIHHTKKYSNNFFKYFVCYITPKFLFFHNVIGSPSNLILSSDFKDFKYSRSLKLLVDVEYYLRIFSIPSIRMRFDKNFKILSIHNDHSITSTIDLKPQKKNELSQLGIKMNRTKKFVLEVMWIIFK